MKKTKLMIVFCGVLAACNAMASGDEGHKTIGAIADRLLKGTNAGAKVQALLKEGESLQSLSVWADCAKGTFCGPRTPEMEAFVIQNPSHNAYHYTNIPVQNKAYIAGGVGTTGHDIVQTLKQAIAVLQGNNTELSNPHRFSERQALLMIAHLVGDIHQPLHVGAAYINKDLQFITPMSQQEVDGINVFDLQGGNNLLIEDKNTWTVRDREIAKRDEELASTTASAAQNTATPPSEKPKRVGKPLHLYWDVTVVENVMRSMQVNSVAEITDKLMATPLDISINTGDAIEWPLQWAADSLVNAKFAYTDLVVTERIKLTSRKGVEYSSWYLQLPTNYIEKSAAITRTQLTIAGYHLAALLQKIWP